MTTSIEYQRIKQIGRDVERQLLASQLQLLLDDHADDLHNQLQSFINELHS